MTREVAGLKRKLTEMRMEADKCQGYRDDLEDLEDLGEADLVRRALSL